MIAEDGVAGATCTPLPSSFGRNMNTGLSAPESASEAPIRSFRIFRMRMTSWKPISVPRCVYLAMLR